MAKRGQNEGSIYERKDGRWCATLNIGWIAGRRTRKSVYGATRQEVQEQLTKMLSDRQRGLPVVVEKQSVAEYLGWWLDNVAKQTVRPSTWASYAELVRLHLAPAFEKVRLGKIGTQHVRALLNAKTDEGLSTRRVQYIHAVLRAGLNTAFRDELIPRNPAALVKPPRVVSKEVTPLTPDEARRFLETIQGDRLEALFTVCVSLGLRQGEALGLRWRDIDFEVGTLRVRYALQRLKRQDNPLESAFHLVEPKTRQSRRTIELPHVTLSSLASHRARHAEERVLAGSKWKTPVLIVDGAEVEVDDLVFVNSVGNPYDAPTATHRFQALLKRAGIGRHRFHDLRHTAATLLSVQGVHPRAIQAALGWENIAMLNRYGHFVEELRAQTARAMDAILNPVAVNVAVKPAAAKVN